MDLDCMSLGASLCGNDLFPLDPPPSLIARYFVSGVPLAELGCEEIYFSRFSIKKSLTVEVQEEGFPQERGFIGCKQ